MKRFVSGFIIGAILFGSMQVSGAIGKVIEVSYSINDVKVNQVSVHSAQKPFLYNGTAYVPLRFVSEYLGYSVKWDEESNVIHIDQKVTEAHTTADKIVETLKANKISLLPPKSKDSYFLLNQTTPVSYRNGTYQHIHIYQFPTIKDREKALQDFQQIRDRADMILPYVFAIENVLVFYVPHTSDQPLQDKLEEAFNTLRKENLSVVRINPW
ncbi:copper amine oxidase N-terminal domain-containing protein [Brevibacillus ruminantium]|uniref:Copper amine oxidase N-terminal domain-containing protein n=1 Tax=Brevibacillus ruminantium TaxID=2950604 RepID=A0ABY4WFK0_9BACL|nr:copper amine oxidase N-terminal domain-containing protein [Brevibacillus ruminantium]USG65519.1 copper amine oxidase N-terminal domain-containing protein [Brevibacillus ruminantium]